MSVEHVAPTILLPCEDKRFFFHSVTKSIAWLQELRCITVVFECDARTNAKTVMVSDECVMYS